MRGEICFVKEDKNFGFIRTYDNKEVFFHFSEIKFYGDVKRGIKVEFEYA